MIKIVVIVVVAPYLLAADEDENLSRSTTHCNHSAESDKENHTCNKVHILLAVIHKLFPYFWPPSRMLPVLNNFCELTNYLSFRFSIVLGEHPSHFCFFKVSLSSIIKCRGENSFQIATHPFQQVSPRFV